MPVQPAVPKPEAPVAVDLSAHRIVVVDDNHDAADSLGTLLSMLEAEVHVTYTGRDALARSPSTSRRSCSWISACRGWTGSRSRARRGAGTPARR